MTPSVLAATVVGELLSRPQYNTDQTNQAAQSNAMLQMCRSLAYKSTPQGIAAGVLTALTFDTNLYDISGAPSTLIHNPANNPTRFTVAVSGTYLVYGQVCVGMSSGSYVYLQLNKNGATMTPIVPAAQAVNTLTGLATVCQFIAVIQLNVNDYVEFMAQHNNTGGANTTLNLTFGSIILISRL